MYLQSRPKIYEIDMRIPKIPTHLMDYKINPKAFINAHNFPNLDALKDEVIRIDNDEEAFKAMLNEPLFLDDFDLLNYYDKKVFNFLDSIVSQEPHLALRRGRGNFIDYHYIGLIKKPKLREVPRFITRAIRNALNIH